MQFLDNYAPNTHYFGIVLENVPNLLIYKLLD